MSQICRNRKPEWGWGRVGLLPFFSFVNIFFFFFKLYIEKKILQRLARVPFMYVKVNRKFVYMDVKIYKPALYPRPPKCQIRNSRFCQVNVSSVLFLFVCSVFSFCLRRFWLDLLYLPLLHTKAFNKHYLWKTDVLFSLFKDR